MTDTREMLEGFSGSQLMTTPQEARKAAIGFHVTSGISKILHGLADQLEAATADRDSWVQQASDRVADAVRFIEERDGIAAARDTWQQQCKERTDEGLVWWQQRNDAVAERDACKMDAARYQTLVDFCHIEYVPEEPWQLVIWEPPTGEDWKAKLDAAIDAAIAKGVKP